MNLPTIEENIKFLDAKVEVCKSYWKNFHMQFTTVMNLLKPPQGSAQAGSTTRKNSSVCIELSDLIVKGRMSSTTLKFFSEELYGFKTL